MELSMIGYSVVLGYPVIRLPFQCHLELHHGQVMVTC